jgi:hypothetical protein
MNMTINEAVTILMRDPHISAKVPDQSERLQVCIQIARDIMAWRDEV